jgi:hypothetical protein
MKSPAATEVLDSEKLDLAEEGFETSTAAKGLEDQVVQLSHAAETVKLKLWTPSMLRLYGVLFIGYLCIVSQGFDGALMGSINAMPAYQSYFKM